MAGKGKKIKWRGQKQEGKTPYKGGRKPPVKLSSSSARADVVHPPISGATAGQGRLGQRRVHVLTSQDFPADWKLWECVLLMKPGEDPRDFGRRRDVWLMPHSLKVAGRMLMCEFESASVLVLRRQRVAV